MGLPSGLLKDTREEEELGVNAPFEVLRRRELLRPLLGVAPAAACLVLLPVGVSGLPVVGSTEEAAASVGVHADD